MLIVYRYSYPIVFKRIFSKPVRFYKKVVKVIMTSKLSEYETFMNYYHQYPITYKFRNQNVSGKYLHAFALVKKLLGGFILIKTLGFMNVWVAKKLMNRRMIYIKNGLPVGRLIRFCKKHRFIASVECTGIWMYEDQVIYIYDESYTSEAYLKDTLTPYDYYANAAFKLYKRNTKYYSNVYSKKWWGKRKMFLT